MGSLGGRGGSGCAPLHVGSGLQQIRSGGGAGGSRGSYFRLCGWGVSLQQPQPGVLLGRQAARPGVRGARVKTDRSPWMGGDGGAGVRHWESEL